MEPRACIECGEEFIPLRNAHVRCSKVCRRLHNKRYSAGWYKKNRAGQLVKQRRYYDAWKLAHPGEHYYGTEYKLFYGARDRAKKSETEFTIQVEDIIVPDECPILGVKMERGSRYAPSIDRKDSTKGYTPDNIWVISKLANRMKNDASLDEIRRFGEWAIKQSKPL